MESNSEASCISDPNFAVICAFLERFAKSCGITHPPFLDLQEMLENIDEVPQQLIDLHIILLRKARRSVFREKWEKALVKFCQLYSTQDGWEIERFGYKNSRLEVKLRVLKNLLEGQFDLNCKFKSIINTHESSELRSKPVGKDKSGRIYWLQIDPISNIRVYREDLDEESWTLVAKDRDTLVQLLQELTVDEEPVDVNLLNEDSSVSVDIEKTILDTGQENGIGDVVTNGDALIEEEKDPLEIKTGETMMNDIGYDDCYNDVLNDVGKRVSEDLFMEGDFKKVKLDNSENDMEVGEAIDDPVMHIYGEGAGAECDAGNPDKEEHNKTDEENSSNTNTSDQTEQGNATSADVKKIELETKPQPKLWSIDTICGTGSFNHSGESSKSVKSVQKNFSSFSIESVLEKKSDSNHSLSPVPESPIISVNTMTGNDPALGSLNQSNEQIISAGDLTSERNESQSINEIAEDISTFEGGKSTEAEGPKEEEKFANCENETDSVPNVESRTNDEDSTVCAQNSVEGKETAAIDQIHDDNLEPVNLEGTTLINQEVPDFVTPCLETSKENIHSESESAEVPIKSESTLKVESDNMDPKQSSDVKETSSEDVDKVNTDDVVKESPVTEMENAEKPPEDITATKSEESKTEDPVDEVSPVKNEDNQPKETPEKQEEEKCEEQVSEVRESAAAEEPEKESEKIDSQVPPDEKAEPSQEMSEIGSSSNEPLVEEKGEQPEKESCIEEDLSARKEVSENLKEYVEEEKPCETIEKVDESEGNMQDEVVLNEQMNVSEPESMLTEQESTQNNIPEEKCEVAEPATEASKAEHESPTCGEVDEAVIPESAPPVDENIKNPIPESTEPCKVEKSDTEILTSDEQPQDEQVLQKQTCSEVKTENDLPEKIDVHDETNDVKSEAPEIPCQDSAEPSKEPGESPPTEVTVKEEIPKPEEICSNDVKTEAEPEKGKEENSEEPPQSVAEELKQDKEPPTSDEIKVEPVEEKADKNDDNEAQKEDDEAAAQPEKGRKRRRSRKQSGEIMPARATRSAKRSIDEDINTFLELPVRKETRKRKSQDSDNADAGKASETGQGEEASTAEGEENKVETRRNSTVHATSDESSVVVQEQVSEVGGKRKKKRSKKKGGSRVRKSTEEKQESSDDEKKVAGEGEATANEEDKKKKAPKTKAKDGTPRTRQLIPERELKLLGISNMEELPTVRQSRRIAQLKMREEAERKKLEEAAKEEAKKDKKRKKKKKKLSKPSAKKRKTAAATGEESYEEEGGGGDDDEDADVKRKDKKRKKKRDKLVFNELNPWISSSGSSSADEDEEEIEDEAHEEEEMLFKSDHEFSPESDIEDPDYKPIKRARTAKVDPKDATEADSKYDDTACEKCGEKDHPEWILLCDKCDKGWHASCVRPALMVVPEGDWFCPPCEHTSLILKLRESLVEYDRCQKQRENEELRRKRLAFVGISLDNVLPSKKEKKPKPVEDNEGESEETASENGGEDSSSSGSSSSDSSSSGESSEPVYQLRERRTNVTSYRYNEYDELIKSALQEEMEAAKGVGLGKGKDIGNQAEGYEEGVEETAVEGSAEQGNDPANVNAEEEAKAVNPQVPRDIAETKPKLKPKKDGDEDYEVESDAEEDEDYNEEENGEAEAEEEDEELNDEVPPVVPRYDKKKKKTRSLNVKGLDFTSDEEEEDNSDSDFKGESSEEESEYSLPSESESSDGIRKKHKSFDGPLRRSTRARTARYDKEFINDDSEDEAPRKKKSRNIWVESESSDSDRSWGKRKKRSTRGGNRSTMPKKKTKAKAKKKKSKKKSGDSDYEDEEKKKRSRNRKVKYGGLDELDEEQVLVRRTRGKKINYQEMNASDSEDEVLKRRPRVIGDSDEEFVAEKERSGDSDAEDEVAVGVTKSETNGKAVSKKSILRKIKKKRPKVIPDPNDFSEEDLLEDEELDAFAEELEDLDEEEEDMLQEMLNDGDVPIRELKEALEKLKERRKEKIEVAKPYPPIPEHMENPGLSPRFPRIGKMKSTPSSTELPSQLGLPAESAVPGVRPNPGVLLGNLPKDGDRHESARNEQQGNMMLLNELKTDSKEGLMGLQPPPYPFPAEGPPGVAPLVNAHAFPLNNRPPAPPYNSFQGILPPHTRLPPEYPHPNIPTTVLGIEKDSLQDIRKQGQKPASNNKRKNEDGLSPQADSGEENSGDGRIGDNVDSPKRRGRGRGKKQLLAETQTKQEIAISTVQAPTQFPPRGPGPEAAAAGSVITRMLNTPQGPQPFPPDFARGRSFRPPFANALRPPLNPPSPSPLRTSSSLTAPPSLPLFHVTLPLDIPPSSIGLPQGKPSQLPPGFPSRPPVLPRYASDPTIRAPFPSHSSSPRGENFPYPNFYPGPFPPPIPNNEEAAFHNPNFPNHPFDEHSIPGSVGSLKPPYEEEAGGEFGGLASYFASQREDDLDT